MKKASSIALILILIVSSVGIHIDYAKCNMTEVENSCHMASPERQDCCQELNEESCCTTSEINQAGTSYDFLVNQFLKISAPVALVSNARIPKITVSSVKNSRNHVFKPPPLFLRSQSVYQVFLC